MPCTGAISGVLSALTLAAAGPPETALIGTEATFPPYIFRDDAGHLTGFDREVGDEVCRRAGLDCSWDVAEFDQLIPGVISGRFDIAMSGIAITPERERIIDFTIAYTDAGGTDHFVGRPDAPGVGQARIGVQSGTIHETHLRETARAFKSYRSEAALFDALIGGQIDLAYGPFGGQERAGFFEAEGLELLAEETVASDGVGMVVCQGNDDLREKLDAAIAGMQNDGTLETISNQWF